jgi:antitoxin CcdA
MEIGMKTQFGERNLKVDADLVDKARELGIDVSSVVEQALRRTIHAHLSDVQREEMKRKFQEENAEAFRSSNEYVEKNGLPLARYRQF